MLDVWSATKYGPAVVVTYNATTDTLVKVTPPLNVRKALFALRATSAIYIKQGTSAVAISSDAFSFLARAAYALQFEEPDLYFWIAVKGVTVGGTCDFTLASSVHDWVCEIIPLAQFTASAASGNSPLSVVFTNTSENAASCLWDFGDGTTSTSTNPTHSFTTTGSYTVTLTVTDLSGQHTSTATTTITVAAIVANFTGTPLTGNAPLDVVFTDTSTGAPTAWDWDYGDGTTHGTTQNPTHTYTVAGTYTVTLVASGHGSTDTEVKSGYLVVQDYVTPTFVAASTNYCGGEHTSLTVNAPAGVADGDYLMALCRIYIGDSGAHGLVAPSGWVELTSYSSGLNIYYVYTKVASSEGVSYTFTRDLIHGWGEIVITIAAYHDVAALDTYSFDIQNPGGTLPPNPLTVTGLVTALPKELLVGWVGSKGIGVFSWTGFVVDYSVNTGGTGYQENTAVVFLYSKTQATAGATGNFTMTRTSGTGGTLINFVFALQGVSV